MTTTRLRSVIAGPERFPPQRNVKVLAKPSAQSDVPLVPEVGERLRLVWRVEVHREPHVEEERHAQRHVGITAEVPIDLKRVAEGPHPGGERRQMIFRVEHHVGPNSEVVRECNLLEKTNREKEEPCADIVAVDALVLAVRELRHHLRVMHDWSRDQLRKEGNEQAVAPKIYVSDLLLIKVGKKGDLLKGNERDAKGQQ